MVLDRGFRDAGAEARARAGEGEGLSYIDVGFGDDRSGFAGLHRFEVMRERDARDVKAGNESEEEKEGVTVWYSSFSCNPLVNKTLSPPLLFEFHKFYAKTLFRDGIREVLRRV